MSRILLRIIVVLALFIEYQAVGQESQGTFNLLKNNLKVIPKELKSIVVFPIKHVNPTIKFIGISLVLVTIDKPTTKFVQHNFDNAIKVRFKNVLGSDDYLITGLLALYGGSILFKYEKGQKAALGSMKATLYSFLYTQLVLKTVFARQRPNSNLSHPTLDESPRTINNWDFGNFHRPYLSSKTYGTAFPSFHFTYTFAIARVLQRTFHNTVIPYSLAIGINMINFSGHHHWVSDMVAGAMIGTMIGSIVTGGIKPIKIRKKEVAPSLTVITNPFTFEQIPVVGVSFLF